MLSNPERKRIVPRRRYLIRNVRGMTNAYGTRCTIIILFFSAGDPHFLGAPQVFVAQQYYFEHTKRLQFDWRTRGSGIQNTHLLEKKKWKTFLSFGLRGVEEDPRHSEKKYPKICYICYRSMRRTQATSKWYSSDIYSVLYVQQPLTHLLIFRGSYTRPSKTKMAEPWHIFLRWHASPVACVTALDYVMMASAATVGGVG